MSSSTTVLRHIAAASIVSFFLFHSSNADAAIRIVANSRSDLADVGLPAINANGDVAFTADLDDGSAAVLRAAGNVRTTIAATAGEYLGFASDAVLDQSGIVTVVADRDSGGRTVVAGNGGDLTVLGVTGADRITAIDPIVAVESSGTVLFSATTFNDGSGSSGRGVYSVLNGVRTLKIAEIFQFLVYGPILPVIAINGNTIHFQTAWFGGSQITQVTTPPFYFSTASVGTNCGGRVFTTVDLLSAQGSGATFRGIDADGHRGVFVEGVNGLCPEMTADDSGNFADFQQAAVTDLGRYAAFHADLDNGGSGIYGGSFGGDPKKLIAVGDSLDGSTVVSLGMGRQAVNDEHDVAFRAVLADGTKGVYVVLRGDPSGVEGAGGGGGSLDWMAIALLLAAAVRRRTIVL